MGTKRKDIFYWQIGAEFSISDDMIKNSYGPNLTPHRFWEPRVDVFETTDSLIIKAELAGIDFGSLSVVLGEDGRTLHIHGTRIETESEPGRRMNCHQLEIFYGDFEREVHLPNIPLDHESIKGSYQDGFLLVTIPKIQEEIVVITDEIIE